MPALTSKVACHNSAFAESRLSKTVYDSQHSKQQEHQRDMLVPLSPKPTGQHDGPRRKPLIQWVVEHRAQSSAPFVVSSKQASPPASPEEQAAVTPWWLWPTLFLCDQLQELLSIRDGCGLKLGTLRKDMQGCLGYMMDCHFPKTHSL